MQGRHAGGMLRATMVRCRGRQNSHKQRNAVEGGCVGCCNANEAGAIISALCSTQTVQLRDIPEHSRTAALIEDCIPKKRTKLLVIHQGRPLSEPSRCCGDARPAQGCQRIGNPDAAELGLSWLGRRDTVCNCLWSRCCRGSPQHWCGSRRRPSWGGCCWAGWTRGGSRRSSRSAGGCSGWPGRPRCHHWSPHCHCCRHAQHASSLGTPE